MIISTIIIIIIIVGIMEQKWKKKTKQTNKGIEFALVPVIILTEGKERGDLDAHVIFDWSTSLQRHITWCRSNLDGLNSLTQGNILRYY